MQMTIDNLNISYINKGKGKNVILIPGWNASYKYFNNLINELSKSYNIYSLDLPGFGESSIPTSVFTTHDYALIIYKFMQKLNITNPTLIGHSFGGKTIIDLITTTDIEVKSAILIDSSGIKRKRNFFTKMKNYRYKTLKKMITSLYKGEKQEYLLDDLKKQYGSKDYNEAKGIMKDILIQIVNEDYTNNLSQIKIPTLLIWGEYDQDTKIEEAKIMEEKIKNSGLVIIKKAHHFPFITNFKECLLIIDNFLQN